VSREDVGRLVHTTRYWRVVAQEDTEEMNALARAELDDAAHRWEVELTEMKQWQARWAVGDHVVVADTCIYLHHLEHFQDIDWHQAAALETDLNVRFVVPMMVVDELDRLKDRGQGPAKTRARHAVQRLTEMFAVGDIDKHRPLKRHPDTDTWVTIEILADPRGRHQRLPVADDEIVERLVALRDLTNKPVTIVTFDAGMSFRTRQAGLRSQLLPQP
jgi:hypothetical protein